MAVIDATGLVIGRLATNVAKRALKGEQIDIVNAEKAIVIGSRESILETYKQKYYVGGVRKGPWYSRMPDKILKRTIRGMIPYRTGHGAEALDRVKVYIGCPKGYDASKFQTVDEAKKSPVRFMTVGDISKELGVKF
ncbi:MAG: 50S ribosomal protein L13 [Thermoplasmata archaeon HGW-Thermoplasmata-2]|nr:MAG: 50S ribosomal protein L13 [Thermoplasmata archaeon HGW-Thermoplasmata-2]